MFKKSSNDEKKVVNLIELYVVPRAIIFKVFQKSSKDEKLSSEIN